MGELPLSDVACGKRWRGHNARAIGPMGSV
jgi:hypothetical protein